MSNGQNFTMPAGDHNDPDPGGPVWNPTGGPNGTGKWETPTTGPAPTDAQGNPAYSSSYSDPVSGEVQNMTGGATAGRVTTLGGAGAYGGYSGTMVRGPDGQLHYDASLNGRAEAVGRAQSLGQAAAGHQAYQINYGTADKYAGLGQDSRSAQADATGLGRDMALNGNAQSQQLGRNMLQQGVQSQQAAAMSTRGGSLAQAAALHQQQGGQGAYMQQGNAQLAAQRADDMATGRGLYMQGASGMRAGDAQAQGLNQDQAKAQMGQELSQRDLNQQGQMSYEAQGQAVNKSAQDMAVGAAEEGQGVDAAASKRNQQQADRNLAFGASVVGAGGSLLASGSGLNGKASGYIDGMEPQSNKPDPYSEAVAASDSRAKTRITSLASFAAQRGR